ncbi:MAG: hypothetical protein RLZZ350_2132 [Verrucomicrobiota bacterium]
MKKIFGLLVAISFTASAAVPSAEKLLPDDTLAVVSVPDCARARERAVTSPQLQFWHDDAMKPFVAKFTKKFQDEFTAPLEKELGISFSNYTALAQGQFTLALVQNGWQGKADAAPAWLLLVDARTNAALLQTNLATLKQKWAEAGKKFKAEQIRGVEFTVLLLSSNDVPATLKNFVGKKAAPEFTSEEKPTATEAKKDLPTVEIYLGQVDSLLLAGSSPKVLERVLANLAGGESATLAEQGTFADCANVIREANFFGWINAKAFVGIANTLLAPKTEDADAPSPFPFRADKLLAGLGVNGLRALAFAARPGDDGTGGEFFIAAPESERAGLLKIFAGQAGETAPPAFVPADTVKVTRWRFGGKRGWETLEQTLAQIAPQAMLGVNFMFAQAGGDDPKLKETFVANLGDDLLQYQKAPRGQTLAELTAPPSLFLLASPAPEKLLGALKPLFAVAYRRGEPAKEREFLGRKIYSYELAPAPPRTGAPAGAHKLNFAAASGYVALTTDESLLEEFLRAGDTPGKALRDTPGLAAALAHVSGDHTTLSLYENQRETMRATFALYKLIGLKASEPTALGVSSAAVIFKDWADVTLLPDYDAVQKYFHFTVSAVNVTESGIQFKFFAPTPPELQK